MSPPRTKVHKQSSLLAMKKASREDWLFSYLGAECMPPLELFDCIVKEYDLLVLWNNEVQKLLERELLPETLSVTY